MTEAEWLASEDPAAMLEFLSPSPDEGHLNKVGTRKLRLWVEACRATAAPGREFSAKMGLEVSVHDWSHHNGREKECPPSARAALLREVVGNPFRGVVRVAPLPGLSRVLDQADAFTRRALLGTIIVRGDWLTPDVLNLAESAYEGRNPDGTLDPDRLAILSDSLEEAGCPVDSAPCGRCKGAGAFRGDGIGPCDACGYEGTVSVPHPLLAHLRSPGPHFCGCWAVDLILGKE